MPDIYMDVDTAVTIPVNILPLIDDTDFKTRETAIAYNAAGMDLVWNFVTSAGVITQTAVTPTTAGDYDWTNVGDGMYKIEMPASGGASANNNAEGYGWFSGVCNGVLPWRGPVIGFRAVALNDALCDGGDLLDVSVTQIGGDAQSATDLKDFADTGYDPATNKIEGVKLVDTTTTNTDMRGTDSAALASVCTEARLSELDAANLPADVSALSVHLTDIKGTGFVKDTHSLPQCLTATGFSTHTAAAVRAEMDTNSTMLAAIATYVDELESRLTATRAGYLDNLNTITGADGAVLATSQPNYAPLRGGVAMTESYAADGAEATPEQMLYMIWSALSEFAISGTSISCKKLDGTTQAMAFTMDSDTAPTSRTRSA